MIQYTKVEMNRDKILLSGYENDKKVYKKIDFKPCLFIPNKEGNYIGYKTNKKLIKKEFFLKEFRSKIQKYKDAGIDIYGDVQPNYQYIRKILDDNYDIQKIKYCFFDIEVYTEYGFESIEKREAKLISITMWDNKSRKFVVLGLKDYKTSRTDVKYVKCKDERDIFEKFIKYVNTIKPDVLSGWNIDGFDLPFLIERGKKLGIKIEKLSPFNGIYSREVPITKEKSEKRYVIKGLSILDYIDVYKKFLFTAPATPDNFKLDTILKLELGESGGKIDYSEYSNIFEFYNKNFQKFIDYNIQDVEGLVKLNEKKRLLELIFMISYIAGVNFNDTFGTVKIWEILLYNKLMDKNIVIPHKTVDNKDREYEGAWVKEPLVGLHDWIVTFDLNSLYPNIMIQWNLDVSKIIEDYELPKELKEIKRNHNFQDFLNGKWREYKDILQKYNVCMTANGYFFKVDEQSIITKEVKWIYEERKRVKKEMIELKKKYEKVKNTEKENLEKLKNLIEEKNAKNLGLKILLNSFYGAMANKYFLFYDIRIAEAITLTGQFVNRSTANLINKELSKKLKKEKDFIVYADTDSLGICLQDFVKKKENKYEFVNKIADKFIQPLINSHFNEIFESLNCIEQRMVMKKEKIANKALIKAKKAYILSIVDEEGVRYDEPKIKITGLQIIKSSTPKFVRDKLKDFVKRFMLEEMNFEEIKKYIKDVKTKFKEQEMNDIAFPRSITNLDKWIDGNRFKKGTPIHIKGSILYNNLIKERNIKDLDFIRNGDNVFFVYLKDKNPYDFNVLGWMYDFPKQFEDLKKYVDYNKQFEVAFMKFITELLEVAGIKLNMNNKVKF